MKLHQLRYLAAVVDNNLNINQVHVHSAHRHVLTTSYIIVVLLLCGVLQFNAYMKVIHDMLRRAESEQETKLQQLSAIEQEQKSDCSASLVLTYPIIFSICCRTLKIEGNSETNSIVRLLASFESSCFAALFCSAGASTPFIVQLSWTFTSASCQSSLPVSRDSAHATWDAAFWSHG